MRFLRIFSFIMTCIWLGHAQSEAFIANGNPVKKGHWPGVIKLISVKETSPTHPELIASVCSGILISSHLVLTAGHCIRGFENQTWSIIATDALLLTTPIEGGRPYTEYIDDEQSLIDGAIKNRPPSQWNVEGCSEVKVPLLLTKSVDLAVIFFNQVIGRKVTKIDFDYLPAAGDSITYVGYGSSENPFTSLGAYAEAVSDPHVIHKNFANATIWRANTQRLGFKNRDSDSFAGHGDSGGPVYRRGKVIGIMSTIEQNCETIGGSDYGILNTATLLSNSDSKKFLKRAQKHFAFNLEALF